MKKAKGEEMSMEMSIQHLNFLLKTYGGVDSLITKTKQRLQSIPGQVVEAKYDGILNGEGKQAGLVMIKDRLSRQIGKELEKWDLWSKWLKHVPGIGPWIAGNLIMLYYYRFIPICQKCGADLEEFVCTKCGKEAKGDGNLQHRIELKDFQTISKWWAYMGRHIIDGKMPKRKKGVQANWSTTGRTVGYHIGEQLVRQSKRSLYGEFLLDQKAKYERSQPDLKKGHRHNKAKNNAIKLFLSHLWVVAHEIEGLPVTEPYAGVIMGHTNIINPFYWNGPHEVWAGF